MPTYTYECAKCGHVMDVFHSMAETPRVECEACASTRVKRLIGAGAAVVFKGSGFYETDYKRSNGGNGGKTEGAGAPESKTETKTETKAESTSESKPESKSESKSSGESKRSSSEEA